MTDPAAVEQALAYFDALVYFDAHQHVVDAVPSAQYGCTLAAAVRELRHDNELLRHRANREFNQLTERNEQLRLEKYERKQAEAELAALKKDWHDLIGTMCADEVVIRRAAVQLRAELAALKARTCDNCHHYTERLAREGV